MKPIQFGTKAALNASTPKAIKNIYRLIMLLSSVWGVISLTGQVTGISEHAMTIINAWLPIANYAIYQFCQMFGYAESETPNGQG